MNRPKKAQAGHYTQVVWPTTKRVGMACMRGPWGTFIVARYEPRGNIEGQSAWEGGGRKAYEGRGHGIEL